MATMKPMKRNSTLASSTIKNKLRVGFVVPHMFMHRDILPDVIYSPGHLSLELCNRLQESGVEVTLYTPGPVDTSATNISSDLSLFELELSRRGEAGDSYMDLLRKHPFTFVTLARQVQSEIIARAYNDANESKIDIVHVYANEEELALSFAALCRKPTVFTHHDPYNFLVKYKSIFPKYRHLNWISMSHAQRLGMPDDTNWVENIYHGLPKDKFTPTKNPTGEYFAYLGRIIEPKGVHLAIRAVQKYNEEYPPSRLLIAGKHYSDHGKDAYWNKQILPMLDEKNASYIGHISDIPKKQEFLANAKALLVPSIFEEPFGMVAIEALACGTPVIALNSGALPELIEQGTTGIIVSKTLYANGRLDEPRTIQSIADALSHIETIDRKLCRRSFEKRFDVDTMVKRHVDLYNRLVASAKKD